MLRLAVVALSAIGLILLVAFIVSRLARSLKTGLSIRMQVFVALAAIVGAFAFGLGLMVIDRIEARAVRFATQAAEGEATVIANLLQAEISNTGTSLQALARRLGTEARSPLLELRIVGPDGNVYFDGIPAPDSVVGGSVSVSADIRQRGEVAGRVVVFKETIAMRRLLADFAPTILAISLVLGAAAALAAMWIGRAIAAPIEAMSDFSHRVASGEVGAAPPPGASGREVTRLVESLDSMRRELEGRPFVETFAADLSHELKNPVAAIRASAEVLQDGALAERDEAERFVARILESADRIERLLRDLLSLAKMETRGVEELGRVDVAELVQTAIDQLEHDHRVRLRCDGAAYVQGDAMWLGRAVSNLVDNALLHSPAGSPVDVRVELSEDWVRVQVVNDGKVQEHVRKNLFRRFVTTRANKGGTGLGLAILRAVAEAHKGTARLLEPGPPCVEFRLELPRATDESGITRALSAGAGRWPQRPG